MRSFSVYYLSDAVGYQGTTFVRIRKYRSGGACEQWDLNASAYRYHIDGWATTVPGFGVMEG